MENTAILMPNWIGDFILALSVIERKYIAKDRVTLIIPEKLVQLGAVINPYKSIVYHRSTRDDFKSTVNEIRQKGFSRIYLLAYSFSAAYLAFRCDIRVRRGLRSEGRSLLLTDHVPHSSKNRSFHVTREYAQVLETPCIPPEFHSGFTPPSVSPDRSSRTTIIVCPGAAFGPTRRWSGFNEIVTRLPHHHFTLLGNTNDAEIIDREIPFTSTNVENLAGKTTLAEAAQIIATASLVVANDSGLLHLAGYFGIPAIGIYGSTSPRWTRPLGNTTAIVSSRTSCAPCFRKTCRYGTPHCLSSLSTDHIVGILLDAIDKHIPDRFRNRTARHDAEIKGKPYALSRPDSKTGTPAVAAPPLQT